MYETFICNQWFVVSRRVSPASHNVIRCIKIGKTVLKYICSKDCMNTINRLYENVNIQEWNPKYKIIT